MLSFLGNGRIIFIRRTVKRLAPALSLGLLWACASLGIGRRIELQFRLSPIRLEEQRAVPMPDPETGEEFGPRWHAAFPITVHTDSASVTVRGPFIDSCGNSVVRGSADRDADVLMLTVKRVIPDTCADLSSWERYEALLTNVPPGTYRLVVRHFDDMARPDGVAFEEVVEVP